MTVTYEEIEKLYKQLAEYRKIYIREYCRENGTEYREAEELLDKRLALSLLPELKL